MKRSLLAPYAVVLAVLVIMAVIFLWQKSVILRQGYEIAKLKASVESVRTSNFQMRTEISAELSPARILAVLGEEASEYVKPPEGTADMNSKPVRLASK